MAKQALVIGLGRFGMAVVRALSRRGVEVLAVDADEQRVQRAADVVAEAVVLDATDTAALARLSPERRDVCVCAIGDRSTENAILCTALLREAGAQRIIARASDELQARILRRIGAHEVVNPLHEFGERFAVHLMYHGVMAELPLGDGLLITELHPPASMLGQPLKDLQLRRRHEINVVALRRADGRVRFPHPDDVVQEGDVLVVVSGSEAVTNLFERG